MNSNPKPVEITQSFQRDLNQLNSGYDILSKIEYKLKNYLEKPRECESDPILQHKYAQKYAQNPPVALVTDHYESINRLQCLDEKIVKFKLENDCLIKKQLRDNLGKLFDSRRDLRRLSAGAVESHCKSHSPHNDSYTSRGLGKLESTHGSVSGPMYGQTLKKDLSARKFHDFTDSMPTQYIRNTTGHTPSRFGPERDHYYYGNIGHSNSTFGTRSPTRRGVVNTSCDSRMPGTEGTPGLAARYNRTLNTGRSKGVRDFGNETTMRDSVTKKSGKSGKIAGMKISRLGTPGFSGKNFLGNEK